jgi:hypothetical protein
MHSNVAAEYLVLNFVPGVPTSAGIGLPVAENVTELAAPYQIKSILPCWFKFKPASMFICTAPEDLVMRIVLPSEDDVGIIVDVFREIISGRSRFEILVLKSVLKVWISMVLNSTLDAREEILETAGSRLIMM